MRDKVYEYVAKRLREGDPPTIREVQAAMGFKAVETARSHLEALVAEGRLIKRGTASRSYGLPASVFVQGHRIPVVGTVQAGALTLAVEDPEGYLEVERSRSGEELFALRVRGLSMQGAGILPDDMVIARRQQSANEGDIVVALVGEEATVKRLRFAGKKVVLWAENPDFAPIELPPNKLTLLGKVVEVRRYYETIPLLGEAE
jgi:repressor LexA